MYNEVKNSPLKRVESLSIRSERLFICHYCLVIEIQSLPSNVSSA